MTRFKWYRIRRPCTEAQLVKRLQGRAFDAGTDWGFLPLENSEGRSTFRFVWRSKLVAVGVDEQGNPTQQLIDTVDQLVCTLFSTGQATWLRVDDPRRSLRALLNALEIVAGLGFSAEPQSFNAKQQAQVLRRFDDSRMVGMKGVGSSAELKLVARIELASKEGIQPERLAFLKELEYSIDHASYEVVQTRMKGQVTFTSSGAVRINGPLLPFVVAQLEGLLGKRK